MHVSNGIEHGGVVTFWKVTEWTHRGFFEQWLKGAGQGLEVFCPPPRSPSQCLRGALATMHRCPELIRPLSTKEGFQVVREVRGADGNTYEPLHTVKVWAGQNKEDEPRLEVTPCDWEYQEVLRQRLNTHLGMITSTAVGNALVMILNHHLKGTCLRPNGGIYWVENGKLPTWRHVARAAEASAVSGDTCVYCIEHRLTEETVRAVRDGICAEVRAEAAKISQEILSGELGGRALKARAAQAAELREKVKQYEALLSVGLADLHTAIDEAEQGHAAAQLLEAANVTEEVA